MYQRGNSDIERSIVPNPTEVVELRLQCRELFPGASGNSAGKESAYNSGDPGSIPGSGRSPGDGTGYPLQYSWPSLVAQMVKNLPAMRETRV